MQLSVLSNLPVWGFWESVFPSQPLPADRTMKSAPLFESILQFLKQWSQWTLLDRVMELCDTCLWSGALFISVRPSWLHGSPRLDSPRCARIAEDAGASWVVVSSCQSKCQGSGTRRHSEAPRKIAGSALSSRVRDDMVELVLMDLAEGLIFPQAFLRQTWRSDWNERSFSNFQIQIFLNSCIWIGSETKPVPKCRQCEYTAYSNAFWDTIQTMLHVLLIE